VAVDLLVRSEQRPPYGDERCQRDGGGLRLVYCHKCRRPVARVLLTPGSVVEIRCRSCGEKHTEVGR
jgi:hypothetical protein